MPRISALMALFCLFAASVNADQIAVKNASFEVSDPVLAAGGWTNTLSDWDGPANAGDAFIEYIGGFSSEGNNHIGMAQGAEVSQDLGVPALPNTTYALTLGVGSRNASFTVAGNESRFGLYVGGDAEAGGTLLGDGTYDAFSIGSDITFVDTTLQITTGNSVPAGNLFLSLRSTGVNRAHFDNIRLSAVPEPASFGLAVMGLIGLAARSRRR